MSELGVFFDLEDAREKIERWRQDYNTNRPHSSLDDRTPAEFARLFECRPFASLLSVSQANPVSRVRCRRAKTARP
jgi:hypothetical protein